jgi:hypothetical protein
MERDVVTLETAEQLKAAGFPESTYWHYAFPSSKERVLIWKYGREWDFAPHEAGDVEFVKDQIATAIAAPTAQEIADRLPESIDGPDVLANSLMVARMDEGWIARYFDIEGETLWEYRPEPADTMAEALALLWLELRGWRD